MQKLYTPLTTIFVEKKFWKKFWCGSRPIWVTPWEEFLISWKKWRFEIFRTAAPSRASDPWLSPQKDNLSFQKTSFFFSLFIKQNVFFPGTYFSISIEIDLDLGGGSSFWGLGIPWTVIVSTVMSKSKNGNIIKLLLFYDKLTLERGYFLISSYSY